MRKILVDWLIDVETKFKLKAETLFMAVNLLDRATESMYISKSKYQLLGITCLFIASKYEEIYHPRLREYSYVCANAYTESEILQMEELILKATKFNLVFTSSYSLIQLYCSESSLTI